MDNIKEVVAKNLATIRKKRNLTQLELSERLNYSDKAVSRWEKGESLPDIETLYKLSTILEVPISSFFEENAFVEQEDFTIKDHSSNKIIVTILSCAVVWLIATIFYVYLNIYSEMRWWQVFIWAIPLTGLILRYFNKHWGKEVFDIYLKSIILFSAITAVYCQFIQYNVWIVFLLAPLLEAIIIINHYIKPIKNTFPQKKQNKGRINK